MGEATIRERLARRQPYRPVALKTDATLADVAALEARRVELPEVSVEVVPLRSYPLASAAAHALGRVGEITERQLELPEYQSLFQDAQEKTGIEWRLLAALATSDNPELATDWLRFNYSSLTTPDSVYDFGMAMGIFAVDDMAGLDVAWRVRKELNQFSGPGERKPIVSDALCELGRFGQKAGKGWYKYSDDRKPTPDPEVEALIERLTTQAGIKRRSFQPNEIIERTIYALINEGARVLEEGYALRAADIDVIYLTGYGFPAWRGGPMFYADRVGLKHVYERVAAFHGEFGNRWRPAPLLERLAREGRTFQDLDRSAAQLATPRA